MRALAIDAAGPDKPARRLTRSRRIQNKPQTRNKQAPGSANSFALLDVHDEGSDADDLGYDEDGDEIPGLMSDSDCDLDSDGEDSDGFDVISNAELVESLPSKTFPRRTMKTHRTLAKFEEASCSYHSSHCYQQVSPSGDR